MCVRVFVCVCVCLCVFDVAEEKERRVLGVEMAFVSGHMHQCLNTCATAHTKSSLANGIGPRVIL